MVGDTDAISRQVLSVVISNDGGEGRRQNLETHDGHVTVQPSLERTFRYIAHHCCTQSEPNDAKETNEEPQREQEEVPNEEAGHPDEGNLPANELVHIVGAGEKVPRLQLFGFKPGRDLIFNDCLHADLDKLKAVGQFELALQGLQGSAPR
uniref:Uncharacterized protein n=1 Tax=Cacopsylla melanoneura TaxID=428564 RepID=A0A8D8Q4M3_9HEMI